MWLGLIFLITTPHLQIPRVGPDCQRPRSRLQAPRGMTARGLPPCPEGTIRSRRPPRSPCLPPPTPGRGAPPPSPTSTSSPLGPSSRASHHSVSSYLPVSLPFVFIFTFHAGWGAEGRAEDASGRLHRYAFLCTPPGALWGRSQSQSTAPRPPYRPTNPARREGAGQARAYTSPARSGANVGTSAPSCPTPSARAAARLPPAEQSGEEDRPGAEGAPRNGHGRERARSQDSAVRWVSLRSQASCL